MRSHVTNGQLNSDLANVTQLSFVSGGPISQADNASINANLAIWIQAFQNMTVDQLADPAIRICWLNVQAWKTPDNPSPIQPFGAYLRQQGINQLKIIATSRYYAGGLDFIIDFTQAYWGFNGEYMCIWKKNQQGQWFAYEFMVRMTE